MRLLGEDEIARAAQRGEALEVRCEFCAESYTLAPDALRALIRRRVSGAPLRIAHVTGERGFSGGEVQMFLLMEGLRARGHANLLVCPPGSGAEREARRRGFAVECVAMRNDLSLGAARRIAARAAPSTRPRSCTATPAARTGSAASARAGRGVPALSTRRMDRRVKRGLRTRWLYRRLLAARGRDLARGRAAAARGAASRRSGSA